MEGVRDEEIFENLSSQDVTAIRSIQVLHNKELVPMDTFILTFNNQHFQNLTIPVDPFITNPVMVKIFVMANLHALIAVSLTMTVEITYYALIVKGITSLIHNNSKIADEKGGPNGES